MSEDIWDFATAEPAGRVAYGLLSLILIFLFRGNNPAATPVFFLR